MKKKKKIKEETKKKCKEEANYQHLFSQAFSFSSPSRDSGSDQSRAPQKKGGKGQARATTFVNESACMCERVCGEEVMNEWKEGRRVATFLP